jgi:hypothetical protein
MATTKKTAPWDKPAPKNAHHKKLTESQKKRAKDSAKKAGRKYPNLVDNMKVAKES